MTEPSTEMRRLLDVAQTAIGNAYTYAMQECEGTPLLKDMRSLDDDIGSIVDTFEDDDEGETYSGFSDEDDEEEDDDDDDD